MIHAIVIAALIATALGAVLLTLRYRIPVTTRQEADALAEEARAWLAAGRPAVARDEAETTSVKQRVSAP